MTYRELCQREVEWYRRHGRYPERIRRDLSGTAYVIGDWSWNRNHPNKSEVIEYRMKAATTTRNTVRAGISPAESGR